MCLTGLFARRFGAEQIGRELEAAVGVQLAGIDEAQRRRFYSENFEQLMGMSA